MKNLIIYFSGFILVLSVLAFSRAESSNGRFQGNAESECCCQYETYIYLEDGTKKFDVYCYTWTTPERCVKDFARANGKVVQKPKDECRCTRPR
jgi:hypothetical protein